MDNPIKAIEDSLPSVATTNPCPKCLGQGLGTWDHDTGCELPIIQCDCCNGSGRIEVTI